MRFPFLNRVWAHTKQNIKFQRDEVTGEGIAGLPSDEVIETIIRPMDMATEIDAGGGAVGDCDDFSMYVAACLKSLGIPCSFATIAADARDPEQFSHVYVVAYPMTVRGMRMRLPLDASHGEYPGWEKQSMGRFAGVAGIGSGDSVCGECRDARGVGDWVGDSVQVSGREVCVMDVVTSSRHQGRVYRRS